jgi:tol-pal system protein YbgF
MHVRNSKRVTAFAVMLLTAACATVPPEEDPVLIKLNDMDRRLSNIERIVDNQSLVQLTQQVSSLERRTAELQGSSEILLHNAAVAGERQRDLYTDLDARIQALDSALSASAARNVLDGGTLPPGQLPVPGGTDRDNYQAAFELLKEGRYDMAATAFSQYLVTFQDSELADNAQYWLAESYYAANEFEEALKSFQVVITNYPQSRKVPDALLKIGYCNYNLQRWDAARTTLTKVQDDYPETTAARLAGQYLKRMETEGV